MRILVVNDDGPPSPVSPYLRPFLDALHAAGHETVVVIPERPMSWIGKAHAVGKTLTATPRCPESLVLGGSGSCTAPGCGGLGASSPGPSADSADSSSTPASTPGAPAPDRSHHWLVVDGPPASCVHIGLFHAPGRPVDLVLSGPNHGRNAGVVYALSSGTVGAALEAALCGRRAVALSFASKADFPAALVAAAAGRAAALVASLAARWPPAAELCSVNVPMVADVARLPVAYTRPARTYWDRSMFAEEELGQDNEGPPPQPPKEAGALPPRRFRWAPDIPGVDALAKLSDKGEDLWALRRGFISVTPLRANFEAVDLEAK